MLFGKPEVPGEIGVAAQIRQSLDGALHLEHCEIINESSQHSGPATESHFKLIVVSPDFVGVSAVKRHQQLYALLSEQLQGPVHALALHLYTPDEWVAAHNGAPPSPNCRGGSLHNG